MRDAFIGIIADYKGFFGTSDIVLLVLISLLALVLFNNENTNKKYERRRLNPTVFLLSLWSVVAYTVVTLVSGDFYENETLSDEKRPENTTTDKRGKYYKAVLGLAFSAAAIILSGGSVFSKTAMDKSLILSGSAVIKTVSVLLIIAYLVIYYLISKQIFSRTSEKILFLCIVILLHIFGFYSENAAVISMFLSPTTIPSILLHGLLPLILLLYLKYEEKIFEAVKEIDEEQSIEEEIEEEWDMKKHKILNIRNMAIAFLVLVVAFICVVFVLNRKINTLYDATVVLEKAAKSKMTVCELDGADGNVVFTLMISPDGNVTAIGGGDSSNGEAVYEFISSYSDHVDKWYVEGESEEEKGAYDYCVDNGLMVINTYKISGIEKLD